MNQSERPAPTSAELLLIGGRAGVGKSTVGWEVSARLRTANVPHAVLFDGEVIGAIQFSEETDPEFRHAGIDIFLTAKRHGQGLGTDAVRTLARWLIHERGHHRLTIDPAADNTAAIRSYRKAGFKPVGIMRAYGRDYRTGGWADGLLMDLLADELA
ncbi:GNAT family N-acetyltransferase [Streptomyces sp. NRRL S-1813]|uniref:GNAT family N-acetyltransferase n=1 Tax=Streptomyces sp. NRRL S-1813 TaxID=1463888 RepID=UPI0004C5FF39|nr:GNAT family protein [Streptomyces sp. NRRL S-1813]